MPVLDPFGEQLQPTFRAELQERAQRLMTHFAEIGRTPSAEQSVSRHINAALRDAHSLKGAARAVEAAIIERVADAIETALADARTTGQCPAPEWLTHAERAVELLPALGTSGPADTHELDLIVARMTVTEPAPEQVRTPDPSPQPEIPPTPSAGETVRVSTSRLNILLAQSGELSVTQLRIEQRLAELQALQRQLIRERREWHHYRALRAQLERRLQSGGDAQAQDIRAVLAFGDHAEQHDLETLQSVVEITSQLRQDTARLTLISQQFEDEILAARLVPVATLFSPLERLIRDLAQGSGKEIRLVRQENKTEVDRRVVELLRDPLMHMLRNAVDHGIEVPDDRIAAGKPATSVITVGAAQRGDAVEITVEDDGRGLNPNRLRQTAVNRGLLSAERAQELDDQAALELIFLPGFTTNQTVTATSGRGVGMDVVRDHVRQLDGRTSLSSAPGKGTRIRITVPLTLATTRALLIEQGDLTLAVPISMVERSARVQVDQFVGLLGQKTVTIEGAPVPVVELSDVLGQPPSPGREHGRERTTGRWRSYFVLRQDSQRMAFLVDALVGEQELVMKPLGWPLLHVRNVSGAATIASGQTVTILNPSELLASSLGTRRRGTAPMAQTVAPVQNPDRRRRVLVVDDSLPTRMLVRSILETAGYEAQVASDGQDALRALRNETIDLVVSDVEMPRLDGFALTAEIRRDERLRLIPVILITSLGSQEHRERGASAGADAYIHKGEFDQGQLLETISRLL